MKRIKTTVTNIEKGNSVWKAMLKELANVHYIDKVAVDIYGKIHYLTKDQVRALQIVAAKLANNDKEAFEDFKNNVIVYSGRDITHSTHQMHWTNRGHLGYLKEDFEEGFYSSVYGLLDAFDNAQNE